MIFVKVENQVFEETGLLGYHVCLKNSSMLHPLTSGITECANILKRQRHFLSHSISVGKVTWSQLRLCISEKNVHTVLFINYMI